MLQASCTVFLAFAPFSHFVLTALLCCSVIKQCVLEGNGLTGEGGTHTPGKDGVRGRYYDIQHYPCMIAQLTRKDLGRLVDSVLTKQYTILINNHILDNV